MSDKFASADKQISITGGASPRPKVDAKQLLGSMSKDVRKRWMIVGGSAAVILSVIAGVMSSASQPAPKRPPEAGALDTTPRGLSAQKDWKAQTGAELQALKQTVAEGQAAQRELLARMEALRQEVAAKNAGGGGPQAAPRIDFNIPAPPEPPKSIAKPMDPATSPAAPAASIPSVGGASMAPAVFIPPVVQKRAPARAFIPPGVEADRQTAAQPKVQEEMVTNERQGFLPAGSFAAATLISGVEAFTGGTAQSQPQPLVLRIDENAILPNAGRYQIAGCHILASVWGDMSSERVFGRLATLTCVDTNNKLVLSEEVEGMIVDSDGKNGLRGVIQDRQGAKLARSLLAGFAQGMSSAFGVAQSTVSSGPLGATTSITGANAIQAAGYQGAASASKTLADYYLKQAEATLPIIAVDAGRKGSVVFTKSKSLRFETTGAYRMKPKASVKVERE